MASADVVLYHLMLTGEVGAAAPAQEAPAALAQPAAGSAAAAGAAAAAAAAGGLGPLQPAPWAPALMDDPDPMHFDGLFGPDLLQLAGNAPLQSLPAALPAPAGLPPGPPGGGGSPPAGGGPPVPPGGGGPGPPGGAAPPAEAHLSRLTVGSDALPAAGQGLHADKELVVQGGAAFMGPVQVQRLDVLSGRLPVGLQLPEISLPACRRGSAPLAAAWAALTGASAPRPQTAAQRRRCRRTRRGSKQSPSPLGWRRLSSATRQAWLAGCLAVWVPAHLPAVCTCTLPAHPLPPSRLASTASPPAPPCRAARRGSWG